MSDEKKHCEVQSSPGNFLLECFNNYDDDGSGELCKKELKLLMAQLGQDPSSEELDAMIAEIDKDGNGEINFDEFKEMMTGDGCATHIHAGSHFTKKMQLEQKQQKPRSATDANEDRTIFDDAKEFISFGPIFRFAMWVYSERQLILLCGSHFIATMIIWCE